LWGWSDEDTGALSGASDHRSRIGPTEKLLEHSFQLARHIPILPVDKRRLSNVRVVAALNRSKDSVEIAISGYESIVDTAHSVLWVRNQLQRIDGRLTLVEPKTERSRRTLVVPPTIIQRLRDHETRQVAEKPWAGSKWVESGFVFTNRTGGPLQARRVIEEFHKVLKRAGLQRIRFHDLRHSCATLLLVQEVPDRVVMQILGHSDISMTHEYIHVMPELQRKAAERMETLISRDSRHQREQER
jgi:Phage integrase family